jgi:hypothetical protein
MELSPEGVEISPRIILKKYSAVLLLIDFGCTYLREIF